MSRLKFKSGLTLSVFTGKNRNCFPKDDVGPYERVEIRGKHPLLVEQGLCQFFEGSWLPASVPANLLKKIVESEGGISEGELPELKL